MSYNAPSAPGPAPSPDPNARPPVPEAFQATPNAESYVLQADALRRRQLRAALLYGSSRYWRRRQRVWPAAIAGVILAAIVAGIIVVIGAFESQQAINEERGQGQNSEQGQNKTMTPSPVASQPPLVGANAVPDWNAPER